MTIQYIIIGNCCKIKIALIKEEICKRRVQQEKADQYKLFWWLGEVPNNVIIKANRIFFVCICMHLIAQQTNQAVCKSRFTQGTVLFRWLGLWKAKKGLQKEMGDSRTHFRCRYVHLLAASLSVSVWWDIEVCEVLKHLKASPWTSVVWIVHRFVR